MIKDGLDFSFFIDRFIASRLAFNIFNFSEEEKYGASEEFKEILVPLGIKISIKKAKRCLKDNRNKFQGKFKRFINNENLYQYLGKSICNSNKVIFDNSKDKNNLINKFHKEKINQFSPADRWKDAEERIRYIKKNKKIFDKLLIKPLGLIGVQIGKGF